MRGAVSTVVLVAALAAWTPLPTAAAPDDQPAPGGNWFSRTLDRYFGGGIPAGAALEGRPEEIVLRYKTHAGRPIEVVIVHQVDRFAPWASGGSSGDVLNVVTRPFHTSTRDGTVRRYLLFERGDTVDPFALADSERLIRALEFIEDVRIDVVPLGGADGSVAVVVQTRDRWPFGVAGTVEGVGWYEASLFSSNLFGTGLRQENELLVRSDRDVQTGYRGLARQDNIAGTFIRAAAEYEDSYRRLRRRAEVARPLAHPGIRWLGGAAWDRVRERDADRDSDSETGDYWWGRVVPLRERREGGTERPLLVPALRYSRTIFLDRPPVGRDVRREFHNAQNYLAGISYRRQRFYRTSFLFGQGETENLPVGLVLKLSGGYQDGEFNDRVQVWLQKDLIAARDRGDVVFAGLDWGGFYRDGLYEDGLFGMSAGYVTPLMDRGSWRYRFWLRARYDLAINAVSDRVFELGDAAGLRGMDNRQVYGNQRLVASLEHRAFTPWQVLGFRIMLLGFADAGVVTGEDEPLAQGKFYVSAGVGVRIRNPSLVLSAVQLRVAFLNSITDKGVIIGFKVGSAGAPEFLAPGTRPGGFATR